MESKCSHCMKAKPIVFSFTQQQTKDAGREANLCGECVNVMLLNMISWNTDLQNKIFNYLNLVPSP